MSDIQTTNEPDQNGSGTQEPFVKDDTVMLVYVLYAASFIVGITMLIGLVMAYMKRGDADATAQSHYTFLIRTFWIGLIIGIVGLATSFIGVGIVILIALTIWMIIRVVKGFLTYQDGKPIPDPQTNLW